MQSERGRVGKMGQSGKARPDHKWYVCITVSVSFTYRKWRATEEFWIEGHDRDFLKIILEATYRMTGGRETDQETMTFLSYWNKELIVLINILFLSKWVIFKCL